MCHKFCLFLSPLMRFPPQHFSSILINSSTFKWCCGRLEVEKWVTQSYQENRDFYNWLNRKLPATQISARLTAIAERGEIKCAFILKALCTHELTFSGLWCEVGKCCCFRWRNWGRRLVCPIFLHGWGWVLTGRLCLGSHHSHGLTWCDASLALPCHSARSDILIEWIF